MSKLFSFVRKLNLEGSSLETLVNRIDSKCSKDNFNSNKFLLSASNSRKN